MKRHHADMRINSHPAKIVNKETGEVTEVQWKDLTVGDVILILGDDEIPADTIVLACGGVQGATCFVETAAIDGETNLKLKNPCLVREEAGSGSGDRNNAESKNTDQQPNSLFMPITWSSDTMKVEGLSPYYKG